MTDEQPEDRQQSPSPPDPTRETRAGAPTAPGQTVQRRAFLRQLTGEAVVTTGRLAGLSTAFRRSLVAAGVAAVGAPDAPDDDQPPSGPAQIPAPIESLVVPAIPASAPEPASDPASLLSPRQHELLERGSTAILGVNDGSGAPHLTSSTFHWDRMVLRLPSELFAARVARIDADPRVSVLAELGPDSWVAMTGVAAIVSGDDVQAEMLTILRKYMSDDEADRLWMEMRSSGDRVVIRVRPTGFVWRLD